MITARGLRKTFKARKEQVEAVAGIDLDVAEGDLVALLGPNGAGKTTTLRMLTTLLPPTDGSATVAGCDVRTDPAGVRRRIGYIGQGNGAGHYHHVGDELVLQGRAYGLSWREARSRAGELLEALSLTALAKRTAGTLSGGQRRRLDIAMGLVHHPPLLFLDEPSTGLDPQNRALLWEHVLDVRTRLGTTIVLTTHYLDEADRMAERVLVVDHGRIIADDTPDRLKAEFAGDRLTIRLADAAQVHRATEVAARHLEVRESSSAGAVLELRTPSGDTALPALLRALDAAGMPVAAAELARPTLDDVFLSLTGRSLREGEALLSEEVAA